MLEDSISWVLRALPYLAGNGTVFTAAYFSIKSDLQVSFADSPRPKPRLMLSYPTGGETGSY